jgi:aminoglycoside phosphotransferase (APT) family kinase protein
VLTLVLPDGNRRRVVLRRFFENRWLTAEDAAREFRVIGLLRAAGVPCQEALGLDVAGEYFSAPSLLLSYLPGRPQYEASGSASWSEELVHAMLAIHAVTPETQDLSWLPRFSRDAVADELEELAPKAAEAGVLAVRVHECLVANLDRVAWPEPCLIHEDFWPGNTVWFRGRLIGVIDWANAKLGDPRCDLTQCGIDAALVRGIAAYDGIRDAYQRMAPSSLPDLWYWELFNGLRSLLYYKHWLLGYHDAGLTHVTEELARSRIEEFLGLALAEAR